MRVLRSLQEVSMDHRSIVTVGSFDGVHLAHRQVIREVVLRARTRNVEGAVVTFDPHPSDVVTSSRGPVGLLSTLEERLSLLSGLGVDLVLVIDFTFEFSRLTSKEFYQLYLVEGMHVVEVVVGYDHMFGRDREAGIEELADMGRQFGFAVTTIPPYTVGAEIVSSTQVRRLLLSGDVEHAARLLGYQYNLRGTVVPGERRGMAIGYPTANIQPHSPKKIIPARGVYLVDVRLGDQQTYGMMNIGVRPTLTNGTRQTLEVHVFGLDREIYGAELTVAFLRRLRDEQKFSSLEELVAQLGRDKEKSLQLIDEFAKHV